MSLKSGLRFRRKSGDPWVSTNRVLNGLGKRLSNGVGRNPNFDTDETKLLIQLWGDPKVQRALITTHKKHAVILQLAQKMQDFGYFRSAEEITTRIKNLKCFYNRIKKDIESGQESSTKPSWKHFDEMDAIMTRPIFSVRPDEVPAPSLKFRLEQAREERAERRKKIQNEGVLSADPTAEDSQDFLDEDSVDGMDAMEPMIEDNLIPDVEVNIDISETFSAITQDDNAQDLDNHTKSEEQIDMEKTTEMKEEQNSNSTASLDKTNQNKTEEPESTVETKTTENTDTSLLEPKQEPIDVDAEDESNKTNTEIVSQLLSLSNPTSYQVNTSNGNPIVTSTTTTPTTGKISLVPTNFLMQPTKNINTRVATVPVTSPPSSAVVPQQFQLLTSTTQMQPRFILSGAPTSQAMGTTTNTGIINTSTGGIIGTGPGGMKVLLLSSEQAATATTNNSSFPKSLGTFMPLNTGSMLQIQSLPQQSTPMTLQTTTQNANSPKKAVEGCNKPDEKLACKNTLKKKATSQKTESQTLLQQKTQFFQKHRQENQRPTTSQQQEASFTKKDATNLRILLRQLLNAQYESNAINSRRWKLERDRLEFEKTFAERCLNTLPNVVDQLTHIFKPQPESKQHQEQETQTPAQKSASTQIFQATPFMTMSSSGSNIRLQPPKLLFTTVRHPTLLTAQNALSLNSPALTPISSKLVAVTPATTTQTLTINDTELVVPKEEPHDE